MDRDIERGQVVSAEAYVELLRKRLGQRFLVHLFYRGLGPQPRFGINVYWLRDLTDLSMENALVAWVHEFDDHHKLPPVGDAAKLIEEAAAQLETKQ